VIFEKLHGDLAVLGVAIGVAVDELRPDFPQVACADQLAARRAEGLPAGRPAIHQCESHVSTPWREAEHGLGWVGDGRRGSVEEVFVIGIVPELTEIAVGFWLQALSGGVKPTQPSAVAVLAGLEAISALP